MTTYLWNAAIGCSDVAIKYFSSTLLSSLFSLPLPTTLNQSINQSIAFLSKSRLSSGAYKRKKQKLKQINNNKINYTGVLFQSKFGKKWR